MNNYSITKHFSGYPAAHRQPKHTGHCRLIHGHEWAFTLTFTAETVTEEGFVIDFGKLQWIKEFLTENFDHTLLLNRDDPKLTDFLKVFNPTPDDKSADIIIVPNCGAEGLAEYVAHSIEYLMPKDAKLRGVRVIQVTCHEDDKNSATYHLPYC